MATFHGWQGPAPHGPPSTAQAGHTQGQAGQGIGHMGQGGGTAGPQGAAGGGGGSEGGGVRGGAAGGPPSDSGGNRLLVNKSTLDQIRQLMERLVQVTQQTNQTLNAQNPLPSPYVEEFQAKQAAYLELLNKPNKTALDQFHIKRLGQQIKQLTERIQTEQAAPKRMTLENTEDITQGIRSEVPEAIKKAFRPPMTSQSTSTDPPGKIPTKTRSTSTDKPQTRNKKTGTVPKQTKSTGTSPSFISTVDIYPTPPGSTPSRTYPPPRTYPQGEETPRTSRSPIYLRSKDPKTGKGIYLPFQTTW